MPKPTLQEPYKSLEQDIIDCLLAGLHTYRPDLSYPESMSDMQGAVRNLIELFDIKRRVKPFSIPKEEEVIG